MKHTFKSLFLAVLSFCLVLFLGCSVAVDPVSAEKEIREKTDELIQSWKYNDQDWYERNVVSGYLITLQTLDVVNREQVIEYMSSAEEDPDPGTAEIDDWQTIVDGDTAISHYKLGWKFESGGSNEVRITDVWSHRTGQWVLLSEHVSRISLTGSAESDAKEKQEILDFVEACSKSLDMDQITACYHDDFVALAGRDRPQAKAEWVGHFAHTLEAYEISAMSFEPISVIVHGDMAVVTGIDTGTTKNKETQELEEHRQSWTKVLVREDDFWSVISESMNNLPTP